MGKNRSFENVYQVTISGKTTNGSASKVADKVLRAMLDGLAYSSGQQVNVSYKVIKTEGDFDAITGETNE